MTVSGYTLAQLLVHIIEKSGDELTRENIIRQSANLDGFSPPIISPA